METSFKVMSAPRLWAMATGLGTSLAKLNESVLGESTVCYASFISVKLIMSLCMCIEKENMQKRMHYKNVYIVFRIVS